MANINKTVFVLCAMVIVLACSAGWTKIWAEDCDKDDLSQTGMNLCAIDDSKKAERELEAVYKKLTKKISPEGRTKLRAAQNAWTAYRKMQCEFNTLGTLGGSVQPMVLSRCYEAFAEEQTKILKEQLECEEGYLGCGGQ
jgi:uncharacterized protein YecT (DUF1311 family)